MVPDAHKTRAYVPVIPWLHHSVHYISKTCFLILWGYVLKLKWIIFSSSHEGWKPKSKCNLQFGKSSLLKAIFLGNLFLPLGTSRCIRYVIPGDIFHEVYLLCWSFCKSAFTLNWWGRSYFLVIQGTHYSFTNIKYRQKYVTRVKVLSLHSVEGKSSHFSCQPSFWIATRCLKVL